MWKIPQVSETAYDLSGPRDAPVIVFIHGLGLSRRLWDSHLPAFKNFRILNYDLFGHGDSGVAPNAMTLGRYAQQLADLLTDRQIEKAHIIGFSIGGMINRRFAIDFPDKVASLVILNSPHNRGEEAQIAVEGRAIAARDQGAFATLEAAITRWFTPDYLRNDDAAQSVRNWRKDVDPNGYAQAAWVLANGVRELIAPSKAITAPTLVMTCENDSGSTPAMSYAIAKEIEGAVVIIVPCLQHLGLLEQPSSFTTPILNFLDQI